MAGFSTGSVIAYKSDFEPLVSIILAAVVNGTFTATSFNNQIYIVQAYVDAGIVSAQCMYICICMKSFILAG